MKKKSLCNQEGGSIFLFGIGLGIVTLLVLTSAINIAALWVTRSKLDSIADASALAASHSIDVNQIYLSGLNQPIKLDPNLAEKKARQYLNQINAEGQFDEFKILAIEVRQNEVQVTIQANADLPFSYLLPGTWPAVVSSARASLKTFPKN